MFVSDVNDFGNLVFAVHHSDRQLDWTFRRRSSKPKSENSSGNRLKLNRIEFLLQCCFLENSMDCRFSQWWEVYCDRKMGSRVEIRENSKIEGCIIKALSHSIAIFWLSRTSFYSYLSLAQFHLASLFFPEHLKHCVTSSIYTHGPRTKGNRGRVYTSIFYNTTGWIGNSGSEKRKIKKKRRYSSFEGMACRDGGNW